MKKKYIALIMIVMAACFGTLALPSPAAKPAADTTVSVEYLQQIEQQNQRMADSVRMLNIERQLAEYVEKKAEENRNYSLEIFGACMTLITCAIGFLGIFIPWKSNDKLRKKLDETAEKSEKAVGEITDLKTTIQEYSEQAKDSVQKAQKSANEAKALTFFMQALKEDDLDLQIDRYTSAIKINPNFAEAYYNRGYAYDDKGEYDQAIKDYTQAIEINPNYAEAYYNRGIAYRKKGEPDQAIADYDQAVEINPNDAAAYGNRGVAKRNLAEKLEAVGKTAEALALYKAAVKDCDEALKRTQDDKVRGNAIRLKQKCEAAIKRLEGKQE